ELVLRARGRARLLEGGLDLILGLAELIGEQRREGSGLRGGLLLLGDGLQGRPQLLLGDAELARKAAEPVSVSVMAVAGERSAAVAVVPVMGVRRCARSRESGAGKQDCGGSRASGHSRGPPSGSRLTLLRLPALVSHEPGPCHIREAPRRLWSM